MASLDRIPGIRSLVAPTRRRLRDIAVWRAYWPLIAIVSIFLIAALLGIFERAPKQIAAFATLLVFAGIIIAVLRGMRRYQRPDEAEAVQALDAQSELRPLQSLADRPARPEVEGVALWRAHEERLTDAARRLTIPKFKDVWKRVDPLFMRMALPAALVLLAVANGPQLYNRLASALTPDYGSLMGAEKVRIEAWITPPEYSGRAPIFLKSDQVEARVPAGSTMTLRVQAPSTPKLSTVTRTDRETVKFEATPDGAYEANTVVSADSEISVLWWGERRAWTILTTPDAPPTATFAAVPSMGENDRTEFTWAVTDDFGVAALELQISPVDDAARQDFEVIEMGALNPKEASDEVNIDLTRNRWADARVEVRLRATDGAGQVGFSEPHVFVLPEKLLLQPLAKAIQDIRVTILREDDPYTDASLASDALEQGAIFASATTRIDRAPAGIKQASLMLDAVTYEAPRYFKDILIYVGLRSTQRTLEAASTGAEAKQVEPMLWGLALRAEYGTSADALAALQAARKALEEALRDGASEEEIKRLMEAFKDAAQRYVAAKMAEAMAKGLDAPADNRDSAQGSGPSMGGQDFSDMLDALEDLTETGAADQARQLLADITNMLENLEFQQGGSGSGEGFPGMPGEPGESDDDVPQEEREMTETMRELSELLQEQRELNDETLAEQRGERGDPQNGQGELQGQQGQDGGAQGGEPNGQTGEGGTSGPDTRTLAERQQALADIVEELARRQGEAGGGEEGEGEGGVGLNEDLLEAIERAQRRAGRALGDGNAQSALRNQEQATRQLRDLAEGLAEKLDELQAARLGEQGRDAEQAGADPFGNSTNGGVDDSNSVDIPDQVERQRARDILDELRRRFGDTPDEDEREYLERLLDRF